MKNGKRGTNKKSRTITPIKSFFAHAKVSANLNTANYVAIDCEMVEGVRDKDMLARVSVVSYAGKVLLDLYVTPQEVVKDYRSEVTGLSADLLKFNGKPFTNVREKVIALLRDKIVVGHGIFNDFNALKVSHKDFTVRDTCAYKNLRPEGKEKKIPSLKTLAALWLKKDIQKGTHSSVQDARIAMEIFKQRREEWEKEDKNKKK